MPRPRKCRRVCCLPKRNLYGPLGCNENNEKALIMTVDEYEAIRLIDLEGLTQEQCASQMKIARTTVQGIYNEARKKLAASLVKGSIIRIEGGEYEVCGKDKCLRCIGKGCCLEK